MVLLSIYGGAIRWDGVAISHVCRAKLSGFSCKQALQVGVPSEVMLNDAI